MPLIIVLAFIVPYKLPYDITIGEFSMVSRLSILAATTALTLSLTMPAFAQTSDDEIVVTATKRNETIFDVPLAVTAVTGDTLEQAQIRDLSDLQNVAPSLLFSQSTGSNQSILTIRGIGTPGQNAGLEQSVGVVIDGVFRGLRLMIILTLAKLKYCAARKGLFSGKTPQPA